MNRTSSKSRLKVQRETLRVLASAELGVVHGGADKQSDEPLECAIPRTIVLTPIVGTKSMPNPAACPGITFLCGTSPTFQRTNTV